MCKSVSKVLKGIPKQIASISNIDKEAARVALHWVTTNLIPIMSDEELKDIAMYIENLNTAYSVRVKYYTHPESHKFGGTN